MEFTFSDDQKAIRDLAAQIFTDKVTDEYLLNYYQQGRVYDSELWALLAEQGLLGVAVPEALGGTGLGFTELCLVLQEQGRRLAPVPLLSNLVMAAMPIARFASDEQAQQWLPAMVRGELQLTAALGELGMVPGIVAPVDAHRGADNWVLNGVLEAVPYASEAACILLPATDGDGNVSVFLLDTSHDGVIVAPQQTSLGEVQATVTLLDVAVANGSVLGAIGQGAEIVDWIEQHANTALAGMQVGVTEEALRRTAEFTGERKQFGAPIGSFQAVAMRAADAYIDIESIRSTFWSALWRLSEQMDAVAAVRAAKYWACTAGHRVAYATQHLHGGMGVDVEYPIHRYFLFAKHIEFMLGGRNVQLVRMGQYLAANDDSVPEWMLG
jgi:alkylation response protein AidB-like acyl-CoA dehydrogenase